MLGAVLFLLILIVAAVALKAGDARGWFDKVVASAGRQDKRSEYGVFVPLGEFADKAEIIPPPVGCVMAITVKDSDGAVVDRAMIANREEAFALANALFQEARFNGVRFIRNEIYRIEASGGFDGESFGDLTRSADGVLILEVRPAAQEQ